MTAESQKGGSAIPEHIPHENELESLIRASIEELKTQRPLSIEDLRNVLRPDLGDQLSVSYYRAVRLLGLRDLLGQRLASAILYRAGKHLAHSIAFETVDEMIDSLEGYVLAKIVKVQPETDSFTIEMAECATCAGLPNLGEPVCSFEAGIIAGGLEDALKRDVTVNETKCGAMGDTLCRYEAALYPKGQAPEAERELQDPVTCQREVISALAAKASAALDLADELSQKTERLRHLTENLLLHRDRLEAVLNSTQDGIIMVDLAGRLVVANRVFGELFGVDPEQLIGLSDSDVRQGVMGQFKDPLAFNQRVVELYRNPEMIAEDEFEVIAPRQRFLRRAALPVRDRSGAIIGRIFVFHDATVEREVERMRAEFVSVVSHELRTPLTSIKGSIGLILGGATGKLSPRMQELLVIARNNSERLMRLIHDILDLSKIQSGKVEVQLEAESIVDCVWQSVEGIQELARESDIKLTTRFPEEVPPVMMDRDRIQQVMTNLLSNAIKFTAAGGSVEVSVQDLKNWVQVAVRDTGVGIPEEDLERIFDRFHQVDSSSTREKGGTGLGLAISKAIITEHHGRIWAESEIDKGTSVIFQLLKKRGG